MGSYGKLWVKLSKNNFFNKNLLGSSGPLWARL